MRQETAPSERAAPQIPALANAILYRKRAFMIQSGKYTWRNIHIADLADAYALLVEEALKEGSGRAAWGAEGRDVSGGPIRSLIGIRPISFAGKMIYVRNITTITALLDQTQLFN
jgi:hypothetical protein